jgi:deazaflavin-dependent oxidoreductase (nitroreductase family)
MAMAEADDWNTKIINEFRANGGKVGGPFEEMPLLLLHHTGAKTGTERVNPLAYQQVGDSLAIFASAAGSKRDPQWLANLVAHPDTSVEIGTSTVKVHARVAGPAEREPIWTKQKDASSGFAGYEETAAPREIPVVLLDPVA